jgi:hypothetical protein
MPFKKIVHIEKILCKGVRYVSIKYAHVDLYKFITWPKKLGKGKQKWMKYCIISGLKP